MLLTCLVLLAGCEGGPEGTAAASPDAGAWEEPARAAYGAFLSGDISLFDEGNAQMYQLQSWPGFLLPAGELEYAYLDLDGDGAEELLVQRVDDPCTYNAVFHYADGKLVCWQSDMVEMSCRDYPLQDGTMVRQYDDSGARSYTLFRYQADGTVNMLSSLFVREELAEGDGAGQCPYYEADGEEVDQAGFDAQLDALVTSRLLERSAWTAM